MGRDFNWSNYRRLFDISILHAVAQREEVIEEELSCTVLGVLGVYYSHSILFRLHIHDVVFHFIFVLHSECVYYLSIKRRGGNNKVHEEELLLLPTETF